MIFEFEREQVGALRCIPMQMRQKLDMIGIELSIQQWSCLSPAERFRLTDFPCTTEDDRRAFRLLILDLLAQRSDEPVTYLVTRTLSERQETSQMPESVRVQAWSHGVMPPTVGQWLSLTSLQRFALIKLAHSLCETDRFLPALQEFGIISRADAGQTEQASRSDS